MLNEFENEITTKKSENQLSTNPISFLINVIDDNMLFRYNGKLSSSLQQKIEKSVNGFYKTAIIDPSFQSDSVDLSSLIFDKSFSVTELEDAEIPINYSDEFKKQRREEIQINIKLLLFYKIITENQKLWKLNVSNLQNIDGWIYPKNILLKQIPENNVYLLESKSGYQYPELSFFFMGFWIVSTTFISYHFYRKCDLV